MYEMVNKMKESLDFIQKQQKELSVFGGIGALLGWDQMTYMPKSGAADRSEHAALISTLSHERVVSDEFWNHIQTLSSSIEHLDEKNRIIVQKLEEDVEKARKVPSDFVSRMVKATTISYQKWEEARGKNDFKIFSPHLKEIIDLEKEYCGYIDLPGPRYNTLLDDYEEGMTVDRLKNEFNPLKKSLIDLLHDIKNSKRYHQNISTEVHFDIENQKKITERILDNMGLPMDRFRLDESTHPFTTKIGYDDVRITTNYKKEHSLFSLFSTIHEAGHALYELGLPQDEFKNTVISDSPSLGIHESQSRFWENMIGRSYSFWGYFYPEIAQILPDFTEKYTLDTWYKHINRVQPSLIRVEADELTYCLHVILRFEIETGLMDEQITVDELPQIWNENMQEMLGIRPDNDVEGVLQDMHWSGGNIGYFPTYAIGTIYAAQLFNTLTSKHPETLDQINHGQFNYITNWLHEHIHQYGRTYQADELIKRTCGEGLNSQAFIDYLKEKYYPLYDL
jgi:carboxypeptidase Taq